MLTPAEWVALIGAIAGAFVAVVKAASDAAKTRAEVAAMRADMEAARVLDAERRNTNDRMLRETHHQVTPNHGGSIIDATGRLEVAVEALTTGLDRLEAHQRDTAADVRGIRRDIGRINDDHREHERAAEAEHRRLHGRIARLYDRLPAPEQPPHNVD